MKNRLYISILSLALNSVIVWNQTPNWNWTVDIHTANDEVATDVAVDPSSGDIIIVGNWQIDLSSFFPTGALPSQNFTSTYGGNSDGFVAKYDNTGALIWAFKIGCNREDEITAVTVDASGNIYITGYFAENTASFTGTGALTASTTLINADNDDDFFLAKYNSDGELLWVRQGYSTGGRDIGGTDVAAYNNGVFAVGYYNDPVVFDGTTVPDDGRFNQGFLVAYDADGNLQWTVHGSTDNHDYNTKSYFNAIETNGTDVFIAGNFKGNDFDLYDNSNNIVSNVLNSNNGDADIVLFSLTTGGVLNWIQTIGGTDHEEDRGLVLDAANLYLTGGIGNNAVFPGYASNPVSSSGSMDVFLSSHSQADGSTNWVNSLTCSDNGDQLGNSISIDSYSNILITGYYDGTLDFSGTTLSAVNGEDGFIASFNNDGTFFWSKSIGSSGNDEGLGISSGSTDKIYVSGLYDTQADLDGNLLTNDGGDNAFLAQIDLCLIPVGGTATANSAAICTGQNTTITLTGSSGTIQWQSSPSGLGTWSDIIGETGTTVIVSPTSTTDYRAMVSSICGGSDYSSIATISVNPLPTAIISGNATICSGDLTSLDINMTGSTPYNFIYTDGITPVSVSNYNSDYYTTDISPSDTTTYTMVSVTDANSCTNSGTGSAVINVRPEVMITAHPLDVTACLNDNVSFSVMASGINLQYQWQKNGVNITGATGSSLLLNTIAAGDAASYTCVVTSNCGGPLTSDAANLTLYTETSISLHPADEHLCFGDDLTLIVNASGTNLTYQWKKDGVDLAEGVDISGTRTNTLNIANTNTSHTGLYTCEVTGQCGTLKSNPSNVIIDAQTVITTQPTNSQSCPGDNISFNIAATGTNLSFQWQKDNVDIPGETSQSLIISNIDPADAGTYKCYVNNDCGASLVSSSAVLTVNTPTSITTHPSDVLECINHNAFFEVAADGSNMTYQWFRDGVALVDGPNISGANSDKLFISDLTLADAGDYLSEVTGFCGTLQSNAASLDVADNIVINLQPQDQDACIGDHINISLNATGSGLNYQWKKDGIDIAGATNNSISLNNITLSDAAAYQCVITNSCGATLNSSVANLSVSIPATITLQPVPAIRCIGENVTFQIATSVSGASYQWYHDGIALVNGAEINGATSNTLFLSNLLAADAGSYYCQVISSCNTLNSDPADLLVDDNIVITQQPIDKEACQNDNISFTVIANGSNLNYQWRKNSVDMAGETASVLALNSVTIADAGDYQCVISNACGSTINSDAGTLMLNPATAITLQPTGLIACNGDNVSFEITASGSNLSYQWQKNGSDLTDGGSVAGSNTTTLVISDVDNADVAVYSCVVTGSCGILNSDPANLTIYESLNITAHPQNQEACEGNNATFNVAATGTGLSYQWQKDGVDIVGETNSSLILTGIGTADAAVYRCIVSGTCNTAVSNGASLTVNLSPAITLQPADDEICEGGSAGFQITAAGTNLSYQWKLNTTDLTDNGIFSGTNTQTMNLSSATDSEAGVYACEVSNMCGIVNSATAILTVNENIVINAHPQNKVLCEGENALFAIDASGSNLTYQWQKNGVDIGGETFNSLIINNINSSDDGTYACVITGDCGVIVSNGATLTTNLDVAITLQPSDANKCEGDPTTFSVQATGSSLSYKWKVNGTDLTDNGSVNGSGTNTLDISPTLQADAGIYLCEITGVCGTVNSNPVNLTVNQGVSINDHPDSKTRCPGENVTFSITAEGSNLNYQWQKDGVDIPGETNSGLMINNVDAGHGGVYRCVVSGDCATWTSNGALLTINEDISISLQPADLTVCDEGSGGFSVIAGGSDLNYQWKFNGTDLNDDANTSGSNTNSLDLSNLTSARAGIYLCEITGSCGIENSNPVSLIVNDNLAINSHPQNLNACPGENASFSISGTGSNLTYQWQKNGADIPGETNPGLVLNNVTMADAGTYRCIITADCGSLISNGGLLTVYDDITITSQPAPVVNICEDNNLNLNVSISGTVTGYQWQKNGLDLNDAGNMSGSSTDNLIINSVDQSNTGIYTVVIAGNCGSLNSDLSAVTIDPKTTIIQQPVEYTVAEGNNATFSVIAEGVNLTYQWQKDGVDLSDGATISGSATALLNISGALLSDAGAYRVVTAGDCNSVTSNPANLIVNAGTNIIAQPASLEKCEFESAVFNVVASGSGLTYQWRKDGTDLVNNANISGVNTASLTLSSVTESDAGAYTCMVDAENTAPALLTVNKNTAVLSHPVPANKCSGENLILTTSAEGSLLSYIWQKNGVDITDGGNISGSDTDVLSITGISTTDAATYRCVITGTCGTANTNPAIVSISELTKITQQPINQIACEGSTVILSIQATGGNLFYQWKKDGAALTDDIRITGSTSNNLSISNITISDAGSYTCEVTGSCGNENSIIGQLTVNPVTQITLQPSGLNACEGENINLSVIANGDALTYQWQKDGIDLTDGVSVSGAITSDLSITGTTTANAGSYVCVINGSCGSDLSDPAIINAYENTAITTQPADDIICGNNSANLSVTATGNDLTYQWKFNGKEVSDTGNYSGSASSSLNISNADEQYTGSYTCLVSGQCGSINSDLASLLVQKNTVIIDHPVNTVACEGDILNLAVNADGTALAFQWQKDGINLSDNAVVSGSNSNVLLINGTTAADAGSYRCVVNGTCGSQNSNISVVSSGVNTVITSQPTGGFFCENDNLIMSVTANGENLTYQWRRNGVDIADGNKFSGTASPNLTISEVTPDEGGTYTCFVSGDCGSENSALATVEVTRATSIVVEPADIFGCEGDLVSFAVVADGDVQSYQWQKDGVNLSDNATYGGTLSDMLTITNLTSANAGSYRVVVSGTCNTVNSDPAILSAYQNTIIALQPVEGTYCAGNQINLTVSASGGILNYQWKQNGLALSDTGNISGSLTSNLLLNNSTEINEGIYTCVVNGACGSENSSPAQITIEKNTLISQQPVDQTKCTGEIAVFQINADGESITYQWEKDGGPVTDGGKISGATTPILTVNNVDITDNGTYRCVVTGNCGTDNSDAALLTVNEYPASAGIIIGPAEVCQGDSNIIFEVPAITGADSYIWDLPVGISYISGEGSRLIEVYSVPGESGGNITVHAENNCGNGSASPVHVVTAHAIPQAIAGPDQNLCANTTNLNAVNPGTANGLWTVLNGPATVATPSQYNSQITDLREGTNYLLWTVSQNNCSSSDTVIINNNLVSVDAGVDRTICVETITLQGSPVPEGASGSWFVASGVANFSDGTDPNSDASGFAPGINELVWRISKAGCFISDTVEIDNQRPTDSYAGIDQSICDDSTTLSGNSPLIGTGTWSVITGAATISNINQYNSIVTNLGQGDNILRWTTANGICTSIDEVTISNNQVTVNAGIDQLICDRTTDLNAAAPITGTGNWSVISGAAIFVNVNQHDTRVTGLAKGDNLLRWIITNNGCMSSDTVRIINDSPSTSDAGDDQVVTTNMATLQGSIPEVGTGEWILVSGAATITDPALFNTTVTDLGLGDHTLRWLITHNSCTSADDVIITNYMSTETDAGEDQTLCTDNTELDGSIPAIGFGEWSVIKGAASFSDNSDPKATVTNLASGENILRWTVWENGFTWDEVVITNNAPTAANAGSNRSFCADSVDLSANQPIIGTGVWSVVGGSAIFADSSVFNTRATNLAKGNNILKWTITNKGCSNSDEVIITNDLPTTAVAGNDQTICRNVTTLNPNTPTVGTGIWEVLSGSATFNGNEVSNLANGDNVLRWTISNNDCFSSDELIITNNSPSDASAGLDKVICSDSITLSGNNPLYGNGAWTIQNGSASFDDVTTGSPKVTNISAGINVFRWTIINQGCVSFDEVVINNAEVFAIAGIDQTLCDETTILQANTPIVGVGTWSIVGGSGSAQFENPNQPDTRVNGLDKGNNILRWKIQNDICSSSSDVVITNNMPTTAIAGPDQSVCSSGTTLQGNTPAIGTGNWTILGGSGTLADATDPNTVAENLDYGVNTLRWTLVNQGCVSSDEVVIFNNSTTISDAGENQSLCSDSTSLYANIPVYGSGMWTVVSGSATFVDNNDHNTTVTDLGRGTNILEWKITNHDCSSSSNVTILNNIPTQAVAGADQTLCGNTAGLHANTPVIGVGEWTLVSGAGDFASKFAANTMVANLKAGQNILRWTITNNGCSLSDDVIIINDLPQMADAGADMEICSEEADLLANHPGAGSGTWEVISGSAMISNPSSYNTHVTELGFGTNTLRWTVSYDKCITYDEIIIVNNQTDIYAGIDQEIGTSFTTLAANNPTVGSGEWSVVGGAGQFEQPEAFITEVTHIGAGLNTYRWSVNINGCISHDDVTVTYNIPPVASFVANKYSGCPPLEVYFVNNSLDDLPFIWDFDDGATSTEVTTSHIFTEPGNYNARLTVFGKAGEVITKDTLIRVYDRPTAFFRTASQDIYLPDEQAIFINESELAVQYLWDFGDGNTSEELEPWHNYESEGAYNVSLVVWSVNGCLDTIEVENAIEVFESGGLEFPNAFTPSQTGSTDGSYSIKDYTNDIFFPIGEGVDDYHLEIFNKWGILIFESHDIHVGWDGYHQGKLLPEGVYVWKATGRYNNGKKFKKVGTVLLMHQSN